MSCKEMWAISRRRQFLNRSLERRCRDKAECQDVEGGATDLNYILTKVPYFTLQSAKHQHYLGMRND